MGVSAITGVNLGVPAHQRNFVFPDLSSGILTVTHNLNSQYVSVTVFDENNLLIIPDDVDAISTTQLTIDLLAFGSFAGVWRAIIVNTGANVNNIASDLNLSGQAAEDFAVFSGANWQAQGGSELVKVASFTRDMTIASGTQIVTGVGFKPKSIHFMSVRQNTEGSSVGFTFGSAPASNFASSTFALGVSDSMETTSTYCIALHQSGSDSYLGGLLTFNSDGFTIDWDKIGSPTGNLVNRFIAYR